MCDRVYTFREKYRIVKWLQFTQSFWRIIFLQTLTVIYSEMMAQKMTWRKTQLVLQLVLYFSNSVIIVSELKLISATDFVFSGSEGLPVDSLVIEHSQATSVDLVGLQVWRGALLLADFILARPDLVRDKRVLELAAGTGVTSVTAGMFASAVTATDVDRGEETEGDDKQSHGVDVLISCRSYSATFGEKQMSQQQSS